MAIEVIKIPAQGKEDKVYEIRSKRVMIDRDLAECFGVETKVFNQSVKRNLKHFDDSKMFKLTKDECLRSQIVTLNTNQGQHLKYLPNAFTEEGVRLLAQVLKRQVDVNFEPPVEDAKILPELWNKGTVVLYQPNNNTSLEVRVVEGTVWLTQEQIAKLFDVGQPAISKHLSNIFMEEELEKSSVHSILEYTAADGKKYSTQFYNLDAILSVGYRVNSKSATQFRKWATIILKNYLIKGYSINQQLLYAEQRIDNRLLEHDKRLDAVEEKIDFIVKTNLPPQQGVFYDGQVYDAHLFVCDLVRRATKSVVLIDNYVDESILALLDKRSDGVTAKIITGRVPEAFRHDLERHDAQYAPIGIERNSHIHDRFLCIDDTVYHIGASIKDLGKKLFAFSRMELKTEELLSHISTTN